MNFIQRKITDGKVIAYYNFDSGTFDDFVGGFNGDPTGAVINRTEKGQVVYFDGVNDIVDLGDAIDGQLAGATTLSWGALVKIKSFVNNAGMLGLGNAAARQIWFFTQTGGSVQWNSNFDAIATVNATGLETDVWYFFSGSFDIPADRFELYQDGLSIDTDTGMTGTLTTGSNNNFLGFINGFNYANVEIGNFIIFNEALTDSEHSQLFADLEQIRFPTKTQSAKRSELTAGPSEPDLVGEWDMRPTQSGIIDLAGNKDGTINGNPVHTLSFIGNSMIFNGTNSYIDIGNTGQTVKSISFWIKPATTTEDIIDLDGGTHTIEVSGGTLTATGFSSPTIFVDGVEATALSAGVWQHVVISTAAGFSASNMDIGRVSASYFDGQLVDVRLYSDERNLGFVSADYKLGASSAPYRTDWGLPETNAPISSTGLIRDSDFTIGSGQWAIYRNSAGVKALFCQASGFVYTSARLMYQTPTDAAYGTWEFSLIKGGSGTVPLFGFACQEAAAVTDASQNGYVLHIDASESVRLRTITNGALGDIFFTSAGYVDVGAEYRFRITRNAAGVFTGYIKGGAFSTWTLIDTSGGAGTNPSTNTKYTTADYAVWDMDTSDEFMVSDIKGEKGFIKRQGVFDG